MVFSKMRWMGSGVFYSQTTCGWYFKFSLSEIWKSYTDRRCRKNRQFTLNSSNIVMSRNLEDGINETKLIEYCLLHRDDIAPLHLRMLLKWMLLVTDFRLLENSNPTCFWILFVNSFKNGLKLKMGYISKTRKCKISLDNERDKLWGQNFMTYFIQEFKSVLRIWRFVYLQDRSTRMIHLLLFFEELIKL